MYRNTSGLRWLNFREAKAVLMQGCQIFLDKIFQNGEKWTKVPLNYQMAIKYVYKMAEI
jgi:hypothetical protein